jgi:branched-chain amino acid transport system substrate-binding protein
VRGKEDPQNEFDLLEIVQVTPRDAVTYPIDHPDFQGGALGTCNPGA